MWAVEIHRLGFEMIGLWPKNNTVAMKSLWSKLHASIILTLLIFVSNVPMISAAMQSWGNMVVVIDILRIALPLLIVPLKYVIMRWKQTGYFTINIFINGLFIHGVIYVYHYNTCIKCSIFWHFDNMTFLYYKVLLSMVNTMAEDWMAFKSDIERGVMIKRAQTARLIMIVGYVTSIIAVVTVVTLTYFGNEVMFLTNFTSGNKALLLDTYHFYDVDKSPQFELTFFIQTITILLSITIYMTVDIFLLLLILHICGQLENFRYRLVNLVACKNFNEALNNIIASHLRLIRFADNIENTYCLMMLISIFYFTIVFCLSGFLFTVILNEKKMNEAIITQIYFSSIHLFILLMNTLVYCSAGELVLKQCNELHRAVCDLKWYKLESKKARNLVLLMIRAHQPFRITAGKIIPLTMASFCSILKTSSGYISFLLTKHS
ncbi:odorant receptor 43a isoform X2 [Solenopsis invicta]|uniref:odorant receptor 43a isoform X2 n=1 Tax=Solenopsis invicta TaxID=13686 RepID=UPI00193E8698|nr:odorant receptor 43a isoform X2 [Solenopsis invicta]